MAAADAPVEPLARPADAHIQQSVFLIGDAGAPKLAAKGSPELVDPVLLALNGDARASVGELGDDDVTVVYLGDNVDGPGRTEELLRHCVAEGPPRKWRRAPERSGR